MADLGIALFGIWYARAQGADVYRDTQSWEPFQHAAHAQAAGRALAQLHLAAEGYHVAQRQASVLAPRFDGDYQVYGGHQGWLHGHLPGALHADLLTRLNDLRTDYSSAMPAPEVFGEQLRQLGIGASSHVVVYDSAEGFWAARLWWMLRSVGVSASILDGGLHATGRAAPAASTALPATSSKRTAVISPCQPCTLRWWPTTAAWCCMAAVVFLPLPPQSH